MEKWQQIYEKWVNFADLDQHLRDQLTEVKQDKHQLEDSFYKELAFGTAGMRGVLGPGTNRMNIYTVRKAVNGLAIYIKETYTDLEAHGVAVAFDSRYMSQAFALEVAKVLGAHGIRSYVFSTLHPTPLLSFAVRHLQAVAGVMITASHNPAEYNGLKAYNADGGQLVPAEADKVVACIERTDDELLVPTVDKETLEKQGLLNWIGEDVDQAYLAELKQISLLEAEQQTAEKTMPIVFTPLHGTAHDLVLRGLDQLNFTNVHVVKEQAVPDPEFSTVTLPNPEEHQAFTKAIEYGERVGASVLIGTDPDADRIGVAVRNQAGDYTVLTGNQFGSLVLDYLLKQKDDTGRTDRRMIKTIVSTEMARAIAADHNVETIDTLTGFKYIGEKIKQFERTGESFVFGFEESYGCLIRDFVRDKDAVQAAVMACELTYYWNAQGKTLLEALDTLYDTYGYYLEGMSAVTREGKEGTAEIAQIMDSIRANPLQEMGGLRVQQIEDYLAGQRTQVGDKHQVEQIDLPREDVVKYLLEHNSWVALRPSGTEPKIKCYYGVCESSHEESDLQLAALRKTMESIIQA